MSTTISLQRLLLRNTLPGQLGILGVLLLILLVIFYAYASVQLEEKHQSYNQQVLASLSEGVEQTTVQMEALATNDFIVNSLIDLQQRESYLPLFFQSLRINNAAQASIGFFDFDGDLIAGRNWSSVTLNETSAQWRNIVLSQGQSLTAVDADGVFIAVPVLIGGIAEGALAMKANALKNFVRTEQHGAVQLITSPEGKVLFSSRPEVIAVSATVSQDLLQNNVGQQQSYNNFNVISYESYTDAYASLLALIPVLVLAILAVAAVSALSARLAARYAAGTLTDFRQALEHEMDINKPARTNVESCDATELLDIRRSFMHLKNELITLSLSNDKVTSVINAMVELLVVVDKDGNIILFNKAFDSFKAQTGFRSEDLGNLVTILSDSVLGEEKLDAREINYASQLDETNVIVSWYSTPYTDVDGKRLGKVIIGEDITAKRNLESDLLIKTQAIDNSTTSIVISDITKPGQPVVYANRAYEELSGYAVNEIIGSNCKSLQGPETKQENIDELREAIQQRRVANVTILNYRKDGTKFYNRLNLTPIRNDDGTVTHYIGIQQDVTVEEKAAQYLQEAKAKAEESTKLKSGFLASMSHEIRTPINGISGMLQLLEETRLTTQQKEYVGLATTSTQNLLHVINDILDFSKIEAGKLTIENTAFQPLMLFTLVIDHFAIEASEKNLALDYKLNFDESLSIKADPMRIRQILNNLLSNAIKFTEQGTISVNARIAEQDGQSFLTCTVRDTGIGISPEKLATVFEEFNQEDVSTTREYGGTGLGLAICHQLCQLMGGTIKAASSKGQGSQFVFSIPVSIAQTRGQHDDIPVESAPSTENAEAPERSVNVLLVEDNHVNQVIAQNQLSSCQVTVAENGQQAISTLADNPSSFDVVLMDCQMPIMDGFEATRRIRDGEAGQMVQDIPIIALTANAMKGDKERCLNAGMNDYISKPFEAKILKQKVTQFSVRKVH